MSLRESSAVLSDRSTIPERVVVRTSAARDSAVNPAVQAEDNVAGKVVDRKAAVDEKTVGEDLGGSTTGSDSPAQENPAVGDFRGGLYGGGGVSKGRGIGEV